MQNSSHTFLTIPQLGKRWQISERTIRRLIAGRKIVAQKFGRSVRIPLSEIHKSENVQ